MGTLLKNSKFACSVCLCLIVLTATVTHCQSVKCLRQRSFLARFLQTDVTITQIDKITLIPIDKFCHRDVTIGFLSSMEVKKIRT